MSYLRERVSYLIGLAEGMQMSELTNEGKLLRAIIDVMDDMALAIEDLENIQEYHSNQIDDLDQDLCEIESAIFDYGAEYDDEDEYNYFIDEDGTSEYDLHRGDEECGEQCDDECDEQCDDECDECNEECEQEIYMVECPYCFEIIELEKEMFTGNKGNILKCPKCHENIDVTWIYDCDD